MNAVRNGYRVVVLSDPNGRDGDEMRDDITGENNKIKVMDFCAESKRCFTNFLLTQHLQLHVYQPKERG